MTRAREHLSFRVNDEEYALPLDCLQEIRAFNVITPIPTAPPYVLGVMNLHGAVAPVVGLREKFGLPGKPLDRFSVALIVSVAHSEKTSGTEQAPERQKKLIGIMVDAVADVLSIDPEQVEPVPDLGSRVDTSFIKGMVRFQDRYLILLEVEKVVGEAAANDQAAAA